MTVTVINSDVLDALRQMPPDHFGVVVTSPPYWGLRDYGVEGQLGREPTLAEHLARMVEVFAEVHRVLKPDGVCWVNYGDCYATIPSGAMKPKNLCMVPNRFAIAMQEWGWWVRSEIIWAKPNPMPESVTDRPATAHEKIFMFTKAGRYHYDGEAVRIGRASDRLRPLAKGWQRNRTPGNHDDRFPDEEAEFQARVRADKQRGHSRPHAGFNDRWDVMSREDQQANGRNLRNYEPAPVQVWEIPTKGFKEAHFATFPPDLVARCLRASLRKGDAVLDPFGGAGTTGLVADKFGADATLIEINHDYCDLIRRRLAAGLVTLDAPAKAGDMPLFPSDRGVLV